jgi:hypothetical protein
VPFLQVCIQGATEYYACITNSIPACDGILHITDKILLPGNDLALFPRVDRTVYDIQPQQLYAKPAASSSCNQTIWGAIVQEPRLFAIKGIWESLASAKFKPLLESPSTTMTIFVMNDAAFSMNAGSGRSTPPALQLTYAPLELYDSNCQLPVAFPQTPLEPPRNFWQG